MFYCQITNHLSKPGEKPHRIVIQRRDRVYMGFVKNEETVKWEEVDVGRGWEIVREINVSNEGLRLWDLWSEDERAAFIKHIDS